MQRTVGHTDINLLRHISAAFNDIDPAHDSLPLVVRKLQCLVVGDPAMNTTST